MILRVILIGGLLVGLTACKKKTASSALDTESYSYLFFDDFNRADASFSGSTEYSAYPSLSLVEIYNQQIRGLSSNQHFSLTYQTPVATNKKGIIVKSSNIGASGADVALAVMQDANTFAGSVQSAYCGFASSDEVQIYLGGGLVAAGTEEFDFSDGAERTILFLYDGTKFTCTVGDGTTEETIEYTSVVGLSTPYMTIYSGDVGGRSYRLDDFGIIDME